MAKILILIGAHLCTAPRPQKEAATLAAAGHDVTVRGFWFDPELVRRDRQLIAAQNWRFEPILDFQPKHPFINRKIRLQSRFAREQFQRFGVFSPALLGYGARAMLKAAQQKRADLTIVHSEVGLWVGAHLLDQGFRVGVDFEDWFSEDLPPEACKGRPIATLKRLEQRLAQDCAYSLTTSQALANALSKAYRTPQPTVIYNVFPWAERSHLDHQQRDRHNSQIPSIHWFSQTIGVGRGLETLCEALPHLTIPVEIHLRGQCSDRSRQWLESLVPDEWRDRLFIHPTVANAELLSRIAEHDIGLALEVPYCSNKQFTTSNKLFQYLQAGLAVIATDTAGQREIFAQRPAIGRLIPPQDPLALARAIEALLQKPNQLAFAKSAALNAARDLFCWEKQAETIVQAAKAALAH